MRFAAAVVVLCALLFAPAGSTREAQDENTFRMAISLIAGFHSIDPALYGLESRALRPACAALISYPDKPLPAGLVLAPELAQSEPVISRDRKTYTFSIRKDARFSDGSAVTARDFVHALERIFDPKMKSGGGPLTDIVGAREMLAGKATRLAGAVANGRALRLRLTKPVPDFLARLSGLCAVSSALPADPEGAKAPLTSPAPYYVSEYVPGERVVMERNRFYHGQRPQHVARITIDLQGNPSAVADVASGKLDHVAPTPDLNPELAGLARRYGVNRGRLFIEPDVGTRMFLMNTSRPLFRDNVPLRRALNYAADRRALAREYGPYAATPTDHYLPRGLPGYRNVRLYPLRGPDLRRARALAHGHRRAGKAVLYTCSDRPDCIGVAQVLQQNLRAIGIKLQIKQFPLGLMFQKLATPGEPFDLAWFGFLADFPDPEDMLQIFDGRTIGQPGNGNWSYFNERTYNRLFARAGRLSGAKRYRAYGELDVRLARDAAPAIAVVNPNTWAFVSKRVGCIVMNPVLDLTAVCLK
jgi:ABC-type transport system substrate-binding protein